MMVNVKLNAIISSLVNQLIIPTLQFFFDNFSYVQEKIMKDTHV